MTVASALLWALEPKPRVPGTEMSLLAISSSSRDQQRRIFEPVGNFDARRWSAIVIDPSGMMEGSAETIGLMHEKLGLGGLAYHFVISNGNGSPDGALQLGHRWVRQADGAYSAGVNGAWYNHNAIGICLIGNPLKKPPTEAQMRELVWLVQELQAQFKIPASQVFVQGGIENPRDPGLFPVATFRQQLAGVGDR